MYTNCTICNDKYDFRFKQISILKCCSNSICKPCLKNHIINNNINHCMFCELNFDDLIFKEDYQVNNIQNDHISFDKLYKIDMDEIDNTFKSYITFIYNIVLYFTEDIYKMVYDFEEIINNNIEEIITEKYNDYKSIEQIYDIEYFFAETTIKKLEYINKILNKLLHYVTIFNYEPQNGFIYNNNCGSVFDMSFYSAVMLNAKYDINLSILGYINIKNIIRHVMYDYIIDFMDHIISEDNFKIIVILFKLYQSMYNEKYVYNTINEEYLPRKLSNNIHINKKTINTNIELLMLLYEIKYDGPNSFVDQIKNVYNDVNINNCIKELESFPILRELIDRSPTNIKISYQNYDDPDYIKFLINNEDNINRINDNIDNIRLIYTKHLTMDILLYNVNHLIKALENIRKIKEIKLYEDDITKMIDTLNNLTKKCDILDRTCLFDHVKLFRIIYSLFNLNSNPNNNISILWKKNIKKRVLGFIHKIAIPILYAKRFIVEFHKLNNNYDKFNNYFIKDIHITVIKNIKHEFDVSYKPNKDKLK